MTAVTNTSGQVSVSEILNDMDLGPTDSIQFAFAKLQLAQSMICKNNAEAFLKQIEETLPLLPRLMNPGGRLGIITFHSLEDRLVKDYFKEVSSFGEESELKIITKKPIIAENQELVINPRARSAKLRVATRN